MIIIYNCLFVIYMHHVCIGHIDTLLVYNWLFGSKYPDSKNLTC